MQHAQAFIDQYAGDQRAVMQYMHQWLARELELVDKIRYGIPFYYRHSWICYLSPTKTGKVEFGFIRGHELSNLQGLLQSKGRKQVYSLELETVATLPLEPLHEIIQEAILLDETKPYASKRGSKR